MLEILILLKKPSRMIAGSESWVGKWEENRNTSHDHICSTGRDLWSSTHRIAVPVNLNLSGNPKSSENITT